MNRALQGLVYTVAALVYLGVLFLIVNYMGCHIAWEVSLMAALYHAFWSAAIGAYVWYRARSEQVLRVETKIYTGVYKFDDPIDEVKA